MPTSSSSAYRSKRGWIAPVSSRTRSSSVVMRSLMRVASSLTDVASARRSASLSALRLPASVAAPPAIVASGVRRSCEIEASSALRIASVSARTSAAWACAAKLGALQRQADLCGKGLQQPVLLRQRDAPWIVAAAAPARRTRVRRPPAADRVPRRRSSVSVPSPAGLQVIEHPLRDARARRRV